MTTTPLPSGSKTRIVLAEGLATAVRNAVDANTSGLRDALAAAFGNARDVIQNPDGTWPTVTRRSWMSYRWVARYNPNAALPTTDQGAQPGDQYIGMADAFLPGTVTTTPETRQAVFVEDFTGTVNGAAWPTLRWTTGLVPAGSGGATTQTEAGVLTSGKAGGYADADRVSMAVADTGRRDLEVAFDFRLDSNDPDVQVRLCLRAPDTQLTMRNGFAFSFGRGQVQASAVLEWAGQTTTATKTHTVGTWYRARVIVADQAGGTVLLRARTWDRAATEPATWDVDTATDRSVGVTGRWGLMAPGLGTAGTAGTVTVDNLAAYTAPAASTASWWGTRA